MPAYPGDSATRISAELGSVSAGNSVPEIARRMLDLFTSGSIEAGTRLPPERQLSASLGVGRSAVRETLAALEILGIVEIRPGSGTYLRGSASELLPETLNWGLMLSAERTTELIELRGELEVSAATFAATRVDADQLASLRAHLDEMRAGLDDLPRFITADVAFHVAIAESAGNTVLTGMLQSVRSMLRLWVERGLRDRTQAEKALAEHAAIVAALEKNDADAAAAAMRAHMATAGERLASETT
ncbi:FadR/GntR family transcriptional regulator [Paramicrobacterium agarici]|uniref:GntR family transcriptional regulator n=1 Tax=Paramicrobacterium agarici TaxID=630514 RepID=A0A2A9E1B8_9MICO|nr:FadR/GntR family transcriptional regulator [Microbacterium agarici]PFG31980.1 GntR family transcriptional regulator [Microbacterium agarici]TQO21871.1 GntR family transcriptional repressor for pyruvate dehydrogenase complex [Microbacterium agarici]